jgi:hypothetical protein
MAGTVSIIVRTMGRPELSRALASLAAQTYQELEVVLVVAKPDCDVTQYGKQSGIHVVAPGRVLDRPNACNAGLDAASGQWIGFLDEDDWLDPSHVENLVSALTQNKEILLAYSDMLAHERDKDVLSSAGFWKRKFSNNPIVWIVTALFSRRLVDEFGCRFDPAFVLLEDWDFFVQCAEFTDCLHVRSATAHYDAHTGSSGGGSGANRDFDRLKPYIERMTQKWGGLYGELIAVADQQLALADTALAAQDMVTAKSHLETGLKVDPGNPMLLNRLALCYRKLGDWQAVLRTLRRAGDSDRESFSLHCDLAQLEHRMGFAMEAKNVLAHLQTLALSEQQRAKLAAITTQIES